MLCVSNTALLLHDNAPAHKVVVAKAALKTCEFEDLLHPPYSPDLFPSLKHFVDDNKRKAATEDWL